MMQVSLKVNISISGTKQEKLEGFSKISGKVDAFIFLPYFRITYPSFTGYGKTAQSILNSLATQIKKVYNERD